MASHQPTHHGYAVRVKDDARYTLDTAPLSEDEVQSLYDMRAEDFWSLVQDVARDHGFRGAYSEGRSAGWCQPYPQPLVDDLWDHEVEAWLDKVFRPFERDVLALMEACREEFLDDLAGAIETAKREPAEAAYWAACDVVTV